MSSGKNRTSYISADQIATAQAFLSNYNALSLLQCFIRWALQGPLTAFSNSPVFCYLHLESKRAAISNVTVTAVTEMVKLFLAASGFAYTQTESPQFRFVQSHSLVVCQHSAENFVDRWHMSMMNRNPLQQAGVTGALGRVADSL